jgi:hypothetical protein
MIVNVEVRPKVSSGRYLPISPASYPTLTGRNKSLNHQTISEQVFGSGAMTKTGSAKTRHSHKLHRAGKHFENALNGVEGGKDARI